jgi:DNA-binding winged helix-turn-helix (wHTH) protein
MLFALLMKLRKILIIGSFFVAVLAAIMLLIPNKENENNADLVKISLRDVGNQLLLCNQDSTSLILPIQKIDELKYQLSFEKALSIHPDSLVVIVAESFKKTNLPTEYQIEVKQCEDDEVAYSYLKFPNEEKSIVPCRGRTLPQKCYTIEVLFLEKIATSSYQVLWILLLLFSIFLAIILLPKKPIKKHTESKLTDENYISFGKFIFFPNENKLVIETKEISLSKKEVELLTIFVANPNKIMKREKLSKQVWEDQGVFVGRSLDTYISKLRKKLSDDETIKLTNIHGIGYNLEIKENEL